MISRLLRQALAGLQYLLTLAVSVIAVVIAVVAFRSIVDDSGGTPATTTTTAPVTTTSTAAAPVATAAQPTFNCDRDAPQKDDERTRVVRLFYACGDANAPTGSTSVYRELGNEGGILTLTMREFVAGPDPTERDDGFRSLFSAATAGAVISVTLDGGAVTIDLRDLGPLPSLAVGADGASFLADLNNTIFQHEDVASVEYKVEGSCDRFWAYFKETGCRVVQWNEWEQNPAAAGQ